MKNNFKKYFAEVIGTFALTLAVSLSIYAGGAVATPIIAGITLGLFVYNLGHISGAHFNPAVTIGLLSIKKIGLSDAISYIISQFIGAWLAMLVAGSVGATLSPIVNGAWVIGLAELIGAFFFTFGIAAVVYRKTPAEFSGVAIGASLLLGEVVAAAIGSNGIINPAVAMGLGSFNIMYALGPIVGAILGMRVYKIFSA